MERRPVVVSILTWNQRQLIKDCLESIFATCRHPNYKICVFNQASKDGTCEYLNSLGTKIEVIHHPENIGFVLANNIVFRKYPDHDVVVLNDDTIVTKNWLESLCDTAYSADDIGAVGSKLIYPNGVLQEAGAEVYQDASGCNIGKGDNPADPKYNVCRQVDYCSGASLFFRRDALDDAGGGFDEAFAPAYYEDTDLCFSIRECGYRVMYEPRSVLFHREGATNGVDVSKGVKKWQAVNRDRFLTKWGNVLRAKHRKGYFDVRSDGQPKVLFMAEFPPLHDQASGDLRLYRSLKILSETHQIVYMALSSVGKERYVQDLEKLGFAVFANDVDRWPMVDLHYTLEEQVKIVDLGSLLAQNNFEFVVCQFHHIAQLYLPILRKACPDTPVIVDSVDIHFLREQREIELKQDAYLASKYYRNKCGELCAYGKSDMTLVVTPKDREALLQVDPSVDVQLLSNVHPVDFSKTERKGREGLLFVGGYSHRPNVDAVEFLVKEIMPLVWEKRPGIRLTLVGSNPPPQVLALASDLVEVTGWVPNTEPFLNRALISIAPLRYGAGMKGKIGEALMAGVPIVTTDIGAEGMGLVDSENILIANDANGIADAICRLLEDETLWQKLSDEGKRHVDRLYGTTAVRNQWDTIVKNIRRKKEKKRRYFQFGMKLFQSEIPIIPGCYNIVVFIESDFDFERTVSQFFQIAPPVCEIWVVVANNAQKAMDWCEENRIRYLVTEQNNIKKVWKEAIPFVSGTYALFVGQWAIVVKNCFDLAKRVFVDNPKAVIVAPNRLPGIEGEILYDFFVRAYGAWKKGLDVKALTDLPEWFFVDIERLEKIGNGRELGKSLGSLVSRRGSIVKAKGIVFADRRAKPEPSPFKGRYSRDKKTISVLVPIEQNDDVESIIKAYRSSAKQSQLKLDLIFACRDENDWGDIFKNSNDITTIKSTNGKITNEIETILPIVRGSVLFVASPKVLPSEFSLLAHHAVHAQEKRTVVASMLADDEIVAFQNEYKESKKVHYQTIELSYFLAPAISIRTETIDEISSLANLESNAVALWAMVRRITDGICYMLSDLKLRFFYTKKQDEIVCESDFGAMGRSLYELSQFDSGYSLSELAAEVLRYGRLNSELYKACVDTLAEMQAKSLKLRRGPIIDGSRLQNRCYQIVAKADMFNGLYERINDLGEKKLKTLLKHKYTDFDEWRSKGKVTALLIRSMWFSYLGLSEKALDLARKARKQESCSASAAFVLGKQLFDSEKIKDSIFHFETALSLFKRARPDEVMVFGNRLSSAVYLSNSYLFTGEHEKVQTLIAQVFAEHPYVQPTVRSSFYKTLKMSYVAQGKTEEAMRFNEYAFWLEPKISDRPIEKEKLLLHI